MPFAEPAPFPLRPLTWLRCHASDLSPVACLLTWGALNIIAGPKKFHAQVADAQDQVYREMDAWYVKEGLETSGEGWRATLYFYCVEITVPERDWGWWIPIVGSWQLLKSAKTGVWVELIPVESEKRFDFKVHKGGDGYAKATRGTKGWSRHRLPPRLVGHPASSRKD